MKLTTSYNSVFDKISTITSALCIFHCVCLPLVFSTLPFLGFEIIENPYVETTTIIIAILIGGYAIVKGYRKYHRNKSIVLLFMVGLTTMIFANSQHDSLNASLFKIVGAIAVVIAHIKNRKTCKHCVTCNQ